MTLKGIEVIMSLYSYRTDVISVKQFPAEYIGTGLYFGIELETALYPGDSLVDQVNASPSWIAKRDSSVAAEYVSVPMMESQVKEKLTEISEAISKISDNSPRGVGMHVHINRAFFSTRTETAFINAVNRELLKKNKLIGRGETTWAEPNTYKNNSRYQAVNVTPHTLEVRIFNTSNDPKIISKRIQWLASLAKAVKSDPLVGYENTNKQLWLPIMLAGALIASLATNFMLVDHVKELTDYNRYLQERVPRCTQAGADNGDC